MSAPSWDLVLVIFFVISGLYGLLLRERVVVTLLGTYAAILITERFGESVYQLLAKSVGTQEPGNLSIFSVQIILLVAIILVVSLKGGIFIHPSAIGRGLIGHLVMGFYGLLSAALIAASVMNFLPPNAKETLLAGSALARFILNYMTWWLILPIVLMLVLSLRGGGE